MTSRPPDTPARTVESVLLDYADIAEVLVVERPTPGFGTRPAAYLVAAPGRSIDLVAAHEVLLATVPEDIRPASYMAVPRPRDGRLERVPAELWLDAYAPPVTDTERRLADIWCEVLDGMRVGREDDFFDLGGHSILVPLTVANILEVFGVHVSVLEGFDHSVLFELAALVDARLAGAGA